MGVDGVCLPQSSNKEVVKTQEDAMPWTPVPAQAVVDMEQ